MRIEVARAKRPSWHDDCPDFVIQLAAPVAAGLVIQPSSVEPRSTIQGTRPPSSEETPTSAAFDRPAISGWKWLAELV